MNVKKNLISLRFSGPHQIFYSFRLVSEISFGQTIKAPITNTDNVTFSGNVSTRDGTGSGAVGVSLRRVTSESSWHEFSTR